MGFIAKNIEGLTSWDIDHKAFWSGRRAGLSAMIRLKDEAEWIIPSLDSIEHWCDEIVICLQGAQSDGTGELVKAWADSRPHAVVYQYPFDSLPNGPGHNLQPRGSVYERAYFYNWCLAKTRCTHVMKWDGDMVAFDDVGDRVRTVMNGADFVGYRGVEIVGDMMVGQRRYTATEFRVFRVTPNTYYETGRMSEVMAAAHHTDAKQVLLEGEDGLFLHFKWAKSITSVQKAWPDNWRSMPHFQEIMQRAVPVGPYDGKIPSVICQTQTT